MKFSHRCRQTCTKTTNTQKYFNCSSALLKIFTTILKSDDFHVKQVTEELVLKELSNLNSYKTTGLNKISAVILKDCASLLKLLVFSSAVFEENDEVLS